MCAFVPHSVSIIHWNCLLTSSLISELSVYTLTVCDSHCIHLIFPSLNVNSEYCLLCAICPWTNPLCIQGNKLKHYLEPTYSTYLPRCNCVYSWSVEVFSAHLVLVCLWFYSDVTLILPLHFLLHRDQHGFISFHLTSKWNTQVQTIEVNSVPSSARQKAAGEIQHSLVQFVS